MEHMKTLTVDGQTYQVCDPEAARIRDEGVEASFAWSGAYTVEQLCPRFSRVGKLVNCEPVAGYPLEVTNKNVSAVTRCGKNLWNFRAGASQVNYYNIKDEVTEGSQINTRYGYEVTLPPGTYTVSAKAVTSDGSDFLFVNVLKEDGRLRGNSINLNSADQTLSATVTIGAGESILVFNGRNVGESTTNAMFGKYDIQIEEGSAVTDYAPYTGATFLPEEGIAALSGVNHLWAKAADGSFTELTVAGKAAPGAVIAALEARLAALETAFVHI